MDWNYDMSEAPRNGRAVFGCDAKGHVVVMHFANGWLGGNDYKERDEFRPVGWMEIPPVNVAA